MKFTRRVYRRARREHIDDLIAYLDRLHEYESNAKVAKRFGIPPSSYDEPIAQTSQLAQRAQRIGMLVVARARREKGMYK